MVLGVDVARFGHDASVIYPRRALDARSILPLAFQGISTDRLVDNVRWRYREILESVTHRSPHFTALLRILYLIAAIRSAAELHIFDRQVIN
jgi:hypothetical protein